MVQEWGTAAGPVPTAEELLAIALLVNTSYVLPGPRADCSKRAFLSDGPLRMCLVGSCAGRGRVERETLQRVNNLLCELGQDRAYLGPAFLLCRKRALG